MAWWADLYLLLCLDKFISHELKTLQLLILSFGFPAGFRPMTVLSFIVREISRLLIGCFVYANDTLNGWILNTLLNIKIKITLISRLTKRGDLALISISTIFYSLILYLEEYVHTWLEWRSIRFKTFPSKTFVWLSMAEKSVFFILKKVSKGKQV